jgi:hypothetical protein
MAGDGTASASQTFTWTVNNPISISEPALQTLSEGVPVSFAIKSTDIHSGTLSYYATGLPAGLTIDSATGLIGGILSNGLQVSGCFFSKVTVSDGTYSNATTVSWQATAPNSGFVTGQGTTIGPLFSSGGPSLRSTTFASSKAAFKTAGKVKPLNGVAYGIMIWHGTHVGLSVT